MHIDIYNHLFFPLLLWYVDKLLGNDDISKYATTFLNNGRQQQEMNGVFCVVRAEML
jgi:hypothetical protein